MIFQSFHGSPGSPEDFFQLESLIGGTWYHQDRRTAQWGQKQPLVEDSILFGYSWGCRELFRSLEHGLKRPAKASPQKVILISPFLFTDPVGLGKKMILNLPVLGKALIASQAESAVKKFIRESSSPQKPSELYALQKDKLKKPETLRSAVLEKDHFAVHNIPEDLEALVIWSEKDQTSSRLNQVTPLMEKLGPSSKLVTISEGGHALPWNRAQEIAKIIQKELKLN